MQFKSLASVMLAIAVSASAIPVVHAQDYDRRDDRRDERHDDRHNDRRDAMAHEDHREHERGFGPEHGFHRGDRLPPEYWSHHYVVDNWREHRLSPPPRGYQWVQNGADYALVAIGTGVIMQLIFGN
ncbi:Ni/Co efflux regulator RcnB [Herbaspirillum sp. Sphag1AN]|uniref:RcnB family protein n=1 Tax=unclassified Herbaspirillum TaxID=2624150 RepID=UPI00161E6068|nr:MULTISPECIES: RcnB family protein [unclassified Herbaspirillum]MBB3214810.1 Ni/Co efflux regulator RcnB [Herbaspirillum sp. Sphag1AN]MBB3248005.1 Ni/Co efflux regulator RcnB [Herbaspirillum sp. Sphag64]